MTTKQIPAFNVSEFIERARQLVRASNEKDTKPTLGAFFVASAVEVKSDTKPLTPLYRWQGGKTKLLSEYKPHLPTAEEFTHYVEPFFGAGALFCHIRNTYPRKPSLINDINPYVVNVLRSIQAEPYQFIKQLKELEQDYIALTTKHERKQFFYDTRNLYWLLEDTRKQQACKLSDIECAAYLYFLMKTSFNGLWQPMKTRYDYFGTAFGLGNEKTGFIDYELIMNWHEQLQDTSITCSSYEELKIPANSFVFCDPPYLDNTVSYGAKRVDTVSLLRWCEAQQENGCTVLLANRSVETSFYEDFSKYDEKITLDVFYTGGKKKTNNKKEVLLIWNKKQNNKNAIAA